LPRTKNENPLTRGKETGKTGEKPIYLEGDRERPEETGRGASGKSRQSIRVLTLLETHVVCNHR